MHTVVRHVVVLVGLLFFDHSLCLIYSRVVTGRTWGAGGEGHRRLD